MAAIERSEQAAAMLHPLRLRVLRELREPGSAASLARRLELPRQKLNYHLRALERVGLLAEVGTRRRGNCVERLLRATARAYVISPEAVGVLGPDPATIGDRLSASYLLAVGAQILRDLARLRRLADAAGKRLATLTVQTEVELASPSDRKAFTEELTAAVEAVVVKYHREGGRPFRVVLGAYPSPAPQPPASDDSEAQA